MCLKWDWKTNPIYMAPWEPDLNNLKGSQLNCKQDFVVVDIDGNMNICGCSQSQQWLSTSVVVCCHLWRRRGTFWMRSRRRMQSQDTGWLSTHMLSLMVRTNCSYMVYVVQQYYSVFTCKAFRCYVCHDCCTEWREPNVESSYYSFSVWTIVFIPCCISSLNPRLVDICE